jgi:hypothetical protein
MELNLRKARKLEAKIKTFLEQSSLEHQVSVRIKGELQEAQDKVKAAAEKLVTDLDLHTKLNELRFAIRNQIAEVNQAVGIHSLMNKKEALQAKAKLLERVVSTELAHGESELKDLLSNTVSSIEQGANRFGQSMVTVETSVVHKDIKDSVKNGINAIKKDLEDLEDSLAQKNIGAKVTLEEDSVKLLQSAGLI